MKRVLMALLGIMILIRPVSSFAGDCGDVNNSASVNILDVTYLINYLYKGGPAPDCGMEYGTVTDINGNIYLTVKIGDQWWMAENLRVTHYRDGDPIPNVTDGVTWGGLTTGAYCDYNNDIANVVNYGRLYNWFAVNDSRNIAPAGWHVPSFEEWQTLVDFLGGDQIAGGKIKEAGTTHWTSPNTGATNESGFTGLPAGYRYIESGYFNHMGLSAFFWSSSESSSTIGCYRALNYDDSAVGRPNVNKSYGFSVRCVRD